MKIEIIAGSPRKGSLTKRVALHLLDQFNNQSGIEADIIDIQQYVLPPVQEVITDVEKAPAALKQLTERMFNADGFVLVSPEYNGGYSPAMKNLLDHFPKQNRKPFGIVTASPGAMGGMRAAMQLQQLVYGLFGIGAPNMLIVPGVDKKFDEEGKLVDMSFSKQISVFVNEFVWLAARLYTHTTFQMSWEEKRA